MSTDLTKPAQGTTYLALRQDPTDLQEIIADTLAGQEVTPNDLPRVAMPSGKTPAWMVPTPEGEQMVKAIEGILVHTARNRAYWPTEFGGGGSTPPACSSVDAVNGFGKPHATAKDPDPAGAGVWTACATCPNAQFGSGKDGIGQACQERAPLFMLLEGGFLPIVVSLSATNLKALRQYLLALVSSGHRASEVITSIGLTPATSAGGVDYCKAVFSKVRDLTDEERAAAKAYADSFKPILTQVAAAEVQGITDATDKG